MDKLLAKSGIYSIGITGCVNKYDMPKARSSKTVGQDSIINDFYHLAGGIFENYHVHKIDFNLVAQVNFSLSL